MKRCGDCEFWIDGVWIEGEVVHQEDRPGECHRNAPRPTLGDFEHEVMKFLSSLAWEAADVTQKKNDFNNWEEASYQATEWPRTTASDWCGEWKARP